jgi:hypothetical protein
MNKLFKRSAIGVALLSVAQLAVAGPIVDEKNPNASMERGTKVTVRHDLTAGSIGNGALDLNFSEIASAGAKKVRVKVVERSGTQRIIHDLGVMKLKNLGGAVSENVDIATSGRLLVTVKGVRGNPTWNTSRLTTGAAPAGDTSIQTPPTASVPEPAPLLMLGAALLGLGFFQRSRGQQARTA